MIRAGAVLTCLALLAGAPGAHAQSGGTPPGSGGQRAKTLRELAADRGLLVGSMLRAPHLDRSGEGEYARFAATQFSVVTAPCYFSWMRPRREVFNFAECDRIVAFADSNGITVRGHTLLWWNALPDWAARLPDAALWEVLRQHIDSTVGRYRGRIKVWDVANELVDPRRPLKNGQVRLRDSTLWIARLGASVIDSAFVWAHRADPAAKLYYNEYGIERGGERARAIVQLVTRLAESGIPIHGVGLQFHIRPTTRLRMAELGRDLGRIAALGLDIQITELDALIGHDRATRRDLDLQAVQYGQVFELCLTVPRCTAVVTWGFTDRRQARSTVTWADAPLLLDRDYRPKPALDSVRAILGRPVSGRGSERQQ